MVTPLSYDECLELLAAAKVGRVALNVGALPSIRTVRFALSAGHVVFRAAPGSALARAAMGVVAFQADHFDPDAGTGWCVEVVGHSEAVTHPTLVGELARLPLEAWAAGGLRDHFFRVRLDRVGGQRVSWPVLGVGNGRE